MAEKKNNKKETAKKETVKTSTTKATTKKASTKAPVTKKSTTTKKTTPAAKKETTKEVKKEVKVVEEVKQPIEKKEKKKVADFVTENYTSIFLVIICILLIANIVLTVIGNQAELKDGEEVIASIDGKKITAEDLFDELKSQYGTNILVNEIDDFIANKEIEDDEEAIEYAKSQVENMKYQYEMYGYEFSDVLAQYGYDSEDDLVEVYKSTYKKEQVVKNYLKENKVTDDEIEKYYEEEIYGDYNAKHILIKSTATDNMSDEEKTAAEDAAKAKAEEVIQKLKDGEDWSTLVKEYSEDTGSVDGDGLIENFTKGDVVDEFFNAVKDLKDDEYTTTPVKSTYGYHVILRVSATEKPELKDKKDDIINALVENYLSNDSTLYDNTWEEIRESYNLEINDTTIKNSYETIIGNN